MVRMGAIDVTTADAADFADRNNLIMCIYNEAIRYHKHLTKLLLLFFFVSRELREAYRQLTQ